MKQTYLTMKILHYGVLALALSAAGIETADARDYSGGGWHHHPTPTPTPSPAPAPAASNTYSSSRSYNSYYRNGGSRSGYNMGWRGGLNNSTGYSGDSVSINTPHRGDWASKLQAQRQWDDMQYRKMQQEHTATVRCGLSNAPAYCYRLRGPYPTEMRIVRY